MRRHHTKTSHGGEPGLLPGQVGQTLRNLASWAVAASLGASGCEPTRGAVGQSVPGLGEAGGSAPVLGTWQALPGSCESTAAPNNVLAAPLKLTRAPDSLQLYVSYARGTGQGGPFPAGVRLLGSTATPCVSSTDRTDRADRDACELARMEHSLPSAACRDASDCHPFLLTTLGAEVTRIDSQAELLELLGSIDTPTEAVVIAVWNGLTFQCAKTDWPKPIRGTEVAATTAGYRVRSQWETCGPQQQDTIDVARDGTVGELMTESLGNSGCIVGRRPEGLVAALPCAVQSRLGAFFASIARLEAASVFAFERMAHELTQLGAPGELIAEARNAACDEIRHAQLTAALALRFGARPVAPIVASPGRRSRFEIALENAVEGCVRETYGALVAHHQARLARDREVATVMSSIAPDETRHAELAFRVAAWLEPQLTETERGLLAHARRVAAIELAREASASGLAEQDARAVGWPSGHVGRQLVQRMTLAIATSQAITPAAQSTC